MNEKLLIKYELESNDGFNLGTLGDSFSGMNAILKDMCELTGIQGDVQVKTTRISQGSVEIYNAIYVPLTTLPFTSTVDLIDFLKIASPELLHHAQMYFSEIGNMHRDINTYFRDNPFDNNVMSGLVTAFIIGSWSWAGRLKSNQLNRDVNHGEISERHASRLRSMVLNGRYKRAVKPIIEGGVSSMSIASLENPGAHYASISEANIGNYLPDDSQILPDLRNGSIHRFTGEIVALQSTKGETLKIKIDGIDPSNSLLTARPDDGKNSEDYKEFYKQHVTLTAEIVRHTMYKRPELVIKEIGRQQEQLF